MNAEPLDELLARCAYPGRMLLVGTAADGLPYWAYAVTGRSDVSKARRAILVEDGLVIESTEPGAALDPLRHYQAIRRVDDALVLGNGSHVDRVTELVRSGADVRVAFAELEPEPDPPIMTPRIVAVCRDATVGWSEVAIGGARQANDPPGIDPPDIESEFTRIGWFSPGTATMVKTYTSDGTTMVSDAVPRTVRFACDRESIAAELWQLLASRYRVLVASGDPQMRNVTVRNAS